MEWVPVSPGAASHWIPQWVLCGKGTIFQHPTNKRARSLKTLSLNFFKCIKNRFCYDIFIRMDHYTSLIFIPSTSGPPPSSRSSLLRYYIHRHTSTYGQSRFFLWRKWCDISLSSLLSFLVPTPHPIIDFLLTLAVLVSCHLYTYLYYIWILNIQHCPFMHVKPQFLWSHHMKQPHEILRNKCFPLF